MYNKRNDTFQPSVRAVFQFLALVLAIFLLGFLISMVIVIETGNVGVRKTLGDIDPEEVGPGIHLRMPLVTSIEEYSAKENPVELTDLTPKAQDNLSLRDFDVTVYYMVAAGRIADLRIKYALPPVRNGIGSIMPIYDLVRKQARSAAYEAVATVPSLEIHKARQQLETVIRDSIQRSMDESDPNTVTVTRVIIRSVRTDPSVEKAIQEAVSAEKKLQAKQVQVEIARKDAEIEIERARGIAKANKIINDSLTPEYLQHELNKALAKFAENGNSSVVVPANMGNLQMLLPTRNLGK